MKKVHEMGNDELLAYLVSSLSKNPKKDMSLAINEIASRMNASQHSVQSDLVPCSICGRSESDHYKFALIHAFAPSR